MVWVVLDKLATGESPEVIAKAYRLAAEGIQAALEYAAELTRERVVSLSADVA
jgi:uncharacterized protein (DUF433 family)